MTRDIWPVVTPWEGAALPATAFAMAALRAAAYPGAPPRPPRRRARRGPPRPAGAAPGPAAARRSSRAAPRPAGSAPRAAGSAPGPAGVAPGAAGFASGAAGAAPRAAGCVAGAPRGSRRCGARGISTLSSEAVALKQLGRGSQLLFAYAAGIARIDRNERRNHESEFILQERLGGDDRCRRCHEFRAD